MCCVSGSQVMQSFCPMDQDRLVRGISAAQRAEAKKTGQETPLRTMARLCEEAGNDGERAALIPPMQALRSQRRCFLNAQGFSDGAVSSSILFWRQFVDSIAYDLAAWEAASPFQLFSVRVEGADIPPIRVLVCKAFLHFLRCLMKTRARGAACGDTTYKV